MALEVLLIILVAASTIALILQGISLWQVSRAATRLMEQVEEQRKSLEADTRELMLKLEGVIESLEPLGRMAENVKTNAEDLSESVRTRAEDLDRFVQEMMSLGRDQAAKFDHAVTDTVQKFEQTTEVIQKDVLRPALEISSFIKGIRAGFSYLFNRKRSARPDENYPEEELFI